MLHKNLHFIQHFELGKDQTAYGIDKKKKICWQGKGRQTNQIRLGKATTLI